MQDPYHASAFLFFFRTVNTFTGCTEVPASFPLPETPFALTTAAALFGGNAGLLMAIEPYIWELYVSRDATGSGNGFGEISGGNCMPPLYFGGGVRGTSRVALEDGGSGVNSLFLLKSNGADEAGLDPAVDKEDLESGGLVAAMLSQSPLIALSSVSVARIARSTVENSCPFIREATTRRTKLGATWPSCGANGDGVEPE